MNKIEAIKEFKDRLLITDYRKKIPEYYEAMEIAVESIEKQIPQEVVNQGGTPLSGYCPSCGEAVTKSSSPVGCKWCLQRVEWSEEKENK